jgi:hypothetical protein
VIVPPHRVDVLEQAIPGILGVGGRGLVGVGDERQPIQLVVGIRRDLLLAVRDLAQVAVGIVQVGFAALERVGARLRSVHGVVGEGRRLPARISQRQQVAIGVVGDTGLAAEGVRDLRDLIERVDFVEGAATEGRGRPQQAARAIEEAGADLPLQDYESDTTADLEAAEGHPHASALPRCRRTDTIPSGKQKNHRTADER